MSTRKKATYLTVLAIGLLAVVVDRLWLRNEDRQPTPRPAAAGTTSSPGLAILPETPLPPPEEQPFGAAWTPPAVYRFPRSWVDLASDGDLRTHDPFLARSGFVRRTPSEEERARGDAAADPLGPPFEEAHRLEAVIVSPLFRRVVIDDRIMSVGDLLDGYRLIRIEAAEAVFKGPAGSVALKLPQESLAGG